MMKLIIVLITLISFKVSAAFLPAGFEADFVQLTKTLRKVQEDPVKVFYKFRGNVYFDVKGNAPVLYVCNDKKVWIYTPAFIESEPGELKIGDSSKYCYSKFFDSLANGLENNKLYTVKKNEKSAELTFSKKASDQLSIDRVELKFKDRISKSTDFLNLDKILIYKSGSKDALTLIVKSVVQKKDLKDSKFTFNPPENTNITKMK